MQNSLVFLHTYSMGITDGKNILKIHLESNKKLLETELEQDLQTRVLGFSPFRRFKMGMRKLLLLLLFVGKKKKQSKNYGPKEQLPLYIAGKKIVSAASNNGRLDIFCESRAKQILQNGQKG